MKVIRFVIPGLGPRLGLWREGGEVIDLTAVDGEIFGSFLDLIWAAKAAGEEPSALVERCVGQKSAPVYDFGELDGRGGRTGAQMISPIDPPEVWAAGVTYERSRQARTREAREKDIYDRVYEAERPELFLKATAGRVVGPNEPIGLRSDSRWMVPEPELCLVLDEAANIVGFTIGNDVSSRDIEGENPLYLPQAKIFRNSCSLGPAIRLAETVDDPYDIVISLRVFREGSLVFEGETSTGRLKRSLDTLVEYLKRDNLVFPGTVLMTGTGIVPPDEFTLRHGDLVEIEARGLGVLRNPVVQLDGR